MSKIRITIFTILIMLLIPIKTFAQTYNASNETLLRAYLSTGGDIVLTEDITISQNTFINHNSTIDLNGHNLHINGSTLVVYETTTLKDTSTGKTGSITGENSNYIVQVGSSTTSGTLILDSTKINCSNKNYCVTIPAKGKLIINNSSVLSKKFAINTTGELEINGGEVITTNGGAIYGNTNGKITLYDGLIKISTDDEAILLSKPGSKFIMNGGRIEAIVENSHNAVGISAFKDTETIINGGTILTSGGAIMGNGSVSGSNDGSNAIFTITGGTLTSLNDLAIYAPSPNGVVTISGGNITGAASGIELRAGKLIITGGTITGNTTNFSSSVNTNGSGIIGAAVAVVQHNTKLPTSVSISGGTFNGSIPFYQANTMNNGPEYTALISYDISGGVFNSTGTETVSIENLNGKFITGGTFTHNVTPFVEDGYGEKTKTGAIEVLKIINVTNNDADATYTSGTIFAGDEVTVTPNDKDGYDVLAIDVVDQNSNHITVSDSNIFISPKNDVNINVIYSKAIITDNTDDLLISNNEETKKTLFKSVANNSELLNRVANIDSTIELVINEKELSEEEKQEIITKAGLSNNVNVMLFDIYIIIKDKDGNEIGRVTELSNDIELEFLVNNIVKKLEKGNERKYYVIRNHDIYELLSSNLSLDGTKLLFKSSKYSEFAIAYEDVKKPNNPETSDNILNCFVILGFSVLMIIYLSNNKTIKNRI